MLRSRWRVSFTLTRNRRKEKVLDEVGVLESALYQPWKYSKPTIPFYSCEALFRHSYTQLLGGASRVSSRHRGRSPPFGWTWQLPSIAWKQPKPPSTATTGWKQRGNIWIFFFPYKIKATFRISILKLRVSLLCPGRETKAFPILTLSEERKVGLATSNDYHVDMFSPCCILWKTEQPGQGWTRTRSQQPWRN